jgi:hypothetical protein
MRFIKGFRRKRIPFSATAKGISSSSLSGQDKNNPTMF